MVSQTVVSIHCKNLRERLGRATKAFDTVSCEGLWKIMAKFGCPAKFIAVVRQFHDGMLARVQNDGEFSDPFPVTNGVKQGCVPASTLQHDVFCHAYRCFPGW